MESCFVQRFAGKFGILFDRKTLNEKKELRTDFLSFLHLGFTKIVVRRLVLTLKKTLLFGCGHIVRISKSLGVVLKLEFS